MSSISGEQAIISVGLDIGTTTTQLVISRLTIKNVAPGSAVPRMEIIDKEILYRSNIHFTPLKDHHLIDAVAVAQIVEREYRAAGFTASDIDTGAVIITGETAKKDNARNIAQSMAGLAGDFVVATAGAHLESVLAGKGSGAAAYSREKHRITVNIDIGGGTSNYGVFREGRAIDTACLNVGGHLMELERDRDRITYIAEPARKVLNFLGLPLVPGDRVSLADLKAVGQAMATCVAELLSSGAPSELTRELLMTPPLRLDYPVDKVMISGGIADYVYSDFEPMSVAQVSRYGDIGPLVGWAVREEMKDKGIEPVRPRETIRATVIGAGTHSVALSGSTISVKKENLPLRNVPVIAPFPGDVPETAEEISMLIESALARATAGESLEQVALAMEGPGKATFEAVQNLARGIVRGSQSYLKEDRPLVVVLTKDYAKVLGQCLQAEMGPGAQVVCIDQVRVEEGDYIDIGKPLFEGRVVPVVVKTLVFGSSPAGSQQGGR